MRGELCVGFATVLSFASLLCLIFMHVGQISTSSVPRHIYMAKVNVSLYGAGLEARLGDPIGGLYTSNASAPLQASAGLRQFYEFGLYSYCGYVDAVNGTCTNSTTARRYEPFDALTADMIANYTQITEAIIKGTSFQDDNYQASTSKAAYYLLLLGTICAGLAFLTGVIKHTVAFLFSAFISIVGSILLLAGSALWTVMLKKSQDINNIDVGDTDSVPFGITVDVGQGIFLMWAGLACLVVSIIPYMISCCTYRG
ncbi:uncharacterized protein STEHIDRAFT_123740 [Stereum hirsutum FP-91666 SS1]|uniref:uncharacterized protein n=1 Tax=Stereum hirsutum (strain FP-91666) TaxID=721885 RepID=UPI0004449ED1|nr:uncharacterized protein STEHIDRAFT_123740 [Stereum hirsutum FP-91666 SS1]EIM83303.1 hypothetical protein STEHIDRAFT_123740 [Stereum hirsutum FP-91666 SS1]